MGEEGHNVHPLPPLAGELPHGAGGWGPRAPERRPSSAEGGGALAKALRILARIAEHGRPVGVQQLARELQMNASTVHRLLKALAREGMVAHEPESRLYAVGTDCIRLATAALGARSLVGRARPVLRALADRSGETCALNLYEPETFTMAIAVVERGPHPLGYDYELGRRDPIHAGASGKAILAFLPDSEIERYLARGRLEPVTGSTVTDAAALRAELRTTRARGWATSLGERVSGPGVGIGAPVIGRTGRVLGSLTLTYPAFREHAGAVADQAEGVCASASTLAGILEAES